MTPSPSLYRATLNQWMTRPERRDEPSETINPDTSTSNSHPFYSDSESTLKLELYVTTTFEHRFARGRLDVDPTEQLQQACKIRVSVGTPHSRKPEALPDITQTGIRTLIPASIYPARLSYNPIGSLLEQYPEIIKKPNPQNRVIH